MTNSVDVARMFLDVGGAMSALKLQMLTYIAHENHILATGSPLVSDNPNAWDKGPTFVNLYRIIGKSDIVSEDILAKKESTQYIKDVWGVFGQRSGESLSGSAQRKGTPWYNAKNPKLNLLEILFWSYRPLLPEITVDSIREYGEQPHIRRWYK